jgi:superfamily II DNA or RNA helicase
MSYLDYSDDNFSDMLQKYEFSSNTGLKKPFVYQEPHQLLLRNYISKPTIYENVLLYHDLGVGKTCTSISIAEGFKEYVNNIGNRIVVLVKNKNIQKNFINELLSRCTENEYVTDEERDLYFDRGVEQLTDVQRRIRIQKRRELANRVHKTINQSYQFYTYGTFVNQVLGAREYEKDEFGRNTTRVKRENGNVRRKKPKDEIKNLNNTVVIVDEAHNVTNNDVYTALHSILLKSYNFRLVLLTATPMYDNVREIFEISNLLNVNDHTLQLPIRKDLVSTTTTEQSLVTRYNSSMINTTALKGGVLQMTDIGKQQLERCLLGKVSFIQSNSDTYPKKIEQGNELIPNRKGTSNVVYCQMSQGQYVTYLNALKNDIKSDSKYDISSAIQNLEASENEQETSSVSKTSSLYKNSSDASTMSYPDGKFGKEGYYSIFDNPTSRSCKVKSEYKTLLRLDGDLKTFSCKIFRLMKNLEQSAGTAFVYSNYVSHGGTSLIRQVLLNNGYSEFRPNSTPDGKSFVMYDESNNVETRERYRRLFNSPENKNGDIIKIIIGSPIISEGVTLKNVRHVHIIEPSWNMSRINQIIGRAVRNYSHHDLEESDRTVNIYKYVSVYYPKDDSFKSIPRNDLHKFFIDREKYVLAEEKDRSNKVVERLLKRISFDCMLMQNRNRNDSKFDHMPECDYQKCDYTCVVQPVSAPDKIRDRETYNLNIDFFDKYDIQYVLGTLRNLFQKSFVWKLADILTAITSHSHTISEEAIFTTLGHVIKNKTLFVDMYNRDGFIINVDDYYIFNSSDIDIQSSIYAKMLDFSKDVSKYNLNEYIKLNFNHNNVKKVKKHVENNVTLPDADLKYNDNIIQSNSVYGTYRQRGTQKNPIGKRDGVFRIVDSRGTESNDRSDFRTQKSGKNAKSFDKQELVDIAKHLGITVKSSVPITEYEKDQLANLIEKFLIENKKVLL